MRKHGYPERAPFDRHAVGMTIDAQALYAKPNLSNHNAKASNHVRSIEEAARKAADAGSLLKTEGGLDKFLAIDWKQAEAELLWHNRELRKALKMKEVVIE